jgi:hypothetical protein
MTMRQLSDRPIAARLAIAPVMMLGTAQCPECQDFDPALEPVLDLGSGKAVKDKCRCIECGRVL